MGRFIMRNLGRWGGLNTDTNPMSLKQGELVNALNCYLRGEALGTRPGLEFDDQYTSSFDPGTNDQIQGLYEARSDFDGVRNLVVIADGKFYVIGQSGGADTPTSVVGASGATITGGQNNLWTFASHKGAVYAAGGARADSPLLKWTIQDEATATGSLNDLSVISVTNLTGNEVDGGLNVFQKWNRLFLNGFRGIGGTLDITSDPMICRYSALNDGDTWDLANTFGGSSAVGGFSAFGGEYTTGFGEYTDNSGDWLLVLTNRRIYSIAQTGQQYSPFAINDVISSGCVSQRAFVNLGIDHGDAVYLSENGFHSIRQSQDYGSREDKFLSWKIRDLFKTVNRSRLKYAAGAYWPEEGVVLFSLSTGSNTTNDLVLCLDVKSNEGRELTADGARWFKWQLPSSLQVNCITPARDASGDPYIYVGTVQGDVCRFQTTTYDDLGTAYSVIFQTKHDDHGVPGVVKFPGDIHLKIQPGGAYRPKMRTIYDFGVKESSAQFLPMVTSNAQWGTARWDVDEWAAPNTTFRVKTRGYGSGETMGFEFSHATANEPFWVADLAYQIAARGEDMGDSTA